MRKTRRVGRWFQVRAQEPCCEPADRLQQMRQWLKKQLDPNFVKVHQHL